MSTDFESWAKESFEIAAKIAYRNGGQIGVPRGGATDCAMVAAAPALPVGYVVNASRIADRRITLAGYSICALDGLCLSALYVMPTVEQSFREGNAMTYSPLLLSR